MPGIPSLLLASGVLTGQALPERLPDQLDLLRAADRTPMVRLVLDMSGSMVQNHEAGPETQCGWYLANRLGELQYPNGDLLSRIDLLLASLTGCRSEFDGILDRWFDRIVFAVDTYAGAAARPQTVEEIFPWPPGLQTNTDIAAIESVLLGPGTAGIQDFWSTPLISAHQFTASRFLSLTDATTRQCRPNAIVLMTDGVGNNPAEVTYSNVTGAPQGARDEGGCYSPTLFSNDGLVLRSGGCSGTQYTPPHGDVAAAYLFGPLDPLQPRANALPQLSGPDPKPIRTYTVGFLVGGGPNYASNRLLGDMARAGGGTYLSADNFEQLYDAFDRIMSQIMANAEASFQAPAQERVGLFSGNSVYRSSFLGVAEGPWVGNVKKHCQFPSEEDRLGANGDRCAFEWVDGEWVANPTPEDEWFGGRATGTNAGGAGAVVYRRLGGFDSNPAPGVNSARIRDIRTWVPGTANFIEVVPQSTDFTESESFALTPCEHFALIHKLHGFTFDTTACRRADNPEPVAFDLWPLADSPYGGQVVLRYGDCDAGDPCLLARTSNTGMLQFFDSGFGNEVVSLVPPEFFRPNNVTHHRLLDVMRQPTLEFTRRHYFDGGMSLHHEDDDQDNVIGPAERALLIAGFGRGGAGYLMFPVQNLGTQTFQDAANGPRGIFRDTDTVFRDLQDTWAAPWTGQFPTDSGNEWVAIFPTGHQAALDAPRAELGRVTSGALAPSGDTEDAPFAVDCTDLQARTGIEGLTRNLRPEECAMPTPQEICLAQFDAATCAALGSGCSACGAETTADCLAAPFFAAPPFCYNWPGYQALTPELFRDYGVVSMIPLSISLGPVQYRDGHSRAIAYRIRFSRMNLQPGDEILILSQDGVVVDRFEGVADNGRLESTWIRSPSFSLRFYTSGNPMDAVPNLDGYGIAGVDVVRDFDPGASPGEARPGIYIVDIDEWEAAPSYESLPAPGNVRQASLVRARISSDCSGYLGGSPCVDASTSEETQDLRFMTCPISAAPSVFTEGGVFRSMYFGDECGQIWSVALDVAGSQWRVRRLLSTNNVEDDGLVRVGESRSFRKIFSSVDLVLSTCTGRRSTGVYFGTGNAQRPSATGTGTGGDALRNLDDPALTQITASARGFQADVVGVVWDSNSVPLGGYTLDDLENATVADTIDPYSESGSRGFFLELEDNEMVLRSPLVFDATAFIETYRTVDPATECEDASGVVQVYGFDNCTAAAFGGDGRLLERQTDVLPGSGLSVVVPPSSMGAEASGPMVVSSLRGRTSSGEPAGANLLNRRDGGPRRNSMRLIMWRSNVEESR